MIYQMRSLNGTRVLITGGNGYIGSHTLLQLLEAGMSVHVIDNFSNSSRDALKRLRSVSASSFTFDEVDLRDLTSLKETFKSFQPDAVLHFAGLKVVAESVYNPLLYYHNNVTGSLNVLSAMDYVECYRIIFSSSASVYGDATYIPIDEKHSVRPLTPYGRTKAIAEDIIRDWVASGSIRSGVSLRYFNPIGAHRTGKIGENPRGTPNNLVPLLAEVALGRLPELQVYGGDFDTRDGTGERDYIHIEDLATGHVAALRHVLTNSGYEVVNLGTGRGLTVLELIKTYISACGVRIPWRLAARRPGDAASSVADARKAELLLGWKAERSIHDACRSSWLWRQRIVGTAARGAD